MEKTIAVINRLEQEGLIGRYAIAGAVAATRYIEPMQTYDLDILVMLPGSPSQLVSLEPIYSYLAQLGYEPQKECVVIDDWPVQFLPVYDELTTEALAEATQTQFGSTPTRVLSAEYLAAIMLKTGRPKDHARLIQFLDPGILKGPIFEKIVTRHKLTEKWKSFRERFLNESS